MSTEEITNPPENENIEGIITPENEPPIPTEEPKDEDANKWHNAIFESRGIDPYDIDYGTAEEETPEWFAIRENAAFEQGQNQFWENLEAAYPDIADLIRHLEAGGTKENYKPSENYNLPSEIEVKQNIETQKALIMRHEKELGRSEARTKTILKAYEEDDELESAALDALKYLENKEKISKENIEKNRAEQEASKNAVVSSISNSLSSVIESGSVYNFTIPKKDMADVLNRVTKTLSYDPASRKMYSIAEVTPENIQDIVSRELFSMKKGNLEGLVQRKAATVNALRIKNTLPVKKIDPKLSDKEKTISLHSI